MLVILCFVFMLCCGPAAYTKYYQQNIEEVTNDKRQTVNIGMQVHARLNEFVLQNTVEKQNESRNQTWSFSKDLFTTAKYAFVPKAINSPQASEKNNNNNRSEIRSAVISMSSIPQYKQGWHIIGPDYRDNPMEALSRQAPKRPVQAFKTYEDGWNDSTSFTRNMNVSDQDGQQRKPMQSVALNFATQYLDSDHDDTELKSGNPMVSYSRAAALDQGIPPMPLRNAPVPPPALVGNNKTDRSTRVTPSREIEVKTVNLSRPPPPPPVGHKNSDSSSTSSNYNL